MNGNQIEVCQCDHEGIFIGMECAELEPEFEEEESRERQYLIPGGCYAIAPPPPLESGYCARITKAHDEWEILEDHRGREGWIDGRQARIETVGPLPDGWADEPPEAPDTRAPEEKRRAAYRDEVDPVCAQITGYRLEAESRRASGDEAEADSLDAKANALVASLADIKSAIRERYPDLAEASDG